VTSEPITAAPTVTGGCCVACLLGQAHTVHDTSLAVVQRTSITAPVRRAPNPDIPGYGETDRFPAI
jgi:hypothetical protein